jgi:hypothetical protein
MFLLLENDQIPYNAALFDDMFIQLFCLSKAENETLVAVF